ncbi:2-amino-4-hydroxy-6-hydroxymethyldihydropteridine diphosphokinase [Taibaiella koreensis]|uniref:2-amino-4-hydroxy-6- hydroxymethyldihydropteridine diphosphokinase n=1 Tax=Taibaiella koreensis TaxID=1268548 RepID=UPI000E59C396|nr:2-amino-4-hydroxy-6-hydroxymethyldihydropteridine diphosphokinase [Taibaiella koreensis]
MTVPSLHDVYLLTGSNQGDRREQLSQAITALERDAGMVVRASGLYETEAWGLEGLPAHLNQALLLQTTLAPLPLLDVIQEIEQRLGRVRQERWGVRAIDIDIIYFDDLVLDLPQLVIPHPLMQERNFVLAPLNEIAPGLVHPVRHKTTSELLQQSSDKLLVWPYTPATDS